MCAEVCLAGRMSPAVAAFAASGVVAAVREKEMRVEFSLVHRGTQESGMS